MYDKKALQGTIFLMLFMLLLAGCGPAETDVAVRDAYQKLVDVWPAYNGCINLWNGL